MANLRQRRTAAGLAQPVQKRYLECPLSFLRLVSQVSTYHRPRLALLALKRLHRAMWSKQQATHRLPDAPLA